LPVVKFAHRNVTQGLRSFCFTLSASAQDTSNAPAAANAAPATTAAAAAGSDVEESGEELAKKLNNPGTVTILLPKKKK
jgi:hypothetical protein